MRQVDRSLAQGEWRSERVLRVAELRRHYKQHPDLSHRDEGSRGLRLLDLPAHGRAPSHRDAVVVRAWPQHRGRQNQERVESIRLVLQLGRVTIPFALEPAQARRDAMS